MNAHLRLSADELVRVGVAIAGAPLSSEPGNPTSGFADSLLRLVAEEDRSAPDLARTARGPADA